MTCTALGECYIKCNCKCFEGEEDDDDELDDRICTCEHKDHYGFCPNECIKNCKLQECNNFKYCNQKSPLYLHKYNYNMCIDCVVKMGPHKIMEKFQECPVCFNNKQMIELKCKHHICNDCWYKITDTGWNNSKGYFNPNCPICRYENIWRPITNPLRP